jgi:fatty-acyl-CoA synthase
MATVDELGYIEIVDRKKDVIISGGENISSIELEGNLYNHPAVLEAAVVAIPHKKWGEVPHAIVVVREGQELSEDELIQFARNKLAHFKAPKSVSFIEAFLKRRPEKFKRYKYENNFGEAGTDLYSSSLIRKSPDHSDPGFF